MRVRNLLRQSWIEELGPTFSCKNNVQGWHGRGCNGDLGCYKSLPGLDVLPLVFLLLGPSSIVFSMIPGIWKAMTFLRGRESRHGFFFWLGKLLVLPGDELPWSAFTGDVASIYSGCIWTKISVSVCVLSIFVWGLLSVIAVDTVVPQDKIYPANSVSGFNSFLSRGCE